MEYWNAFSTRLGRMFSLQNEAKELLRLEFEEGRSGGLEAVLAEREHNGVVLRRAGRRSQEIRAQVAEYLSGKRSRFELPLAPIGTPFQNRAWKALRRIP